MTTLQIDTIRLDFQPAENLNEETVLTYMGRIQQGETLAPVTVRFDGRNYFLQDGFHRVEAAKRCGIQAVNAEISPGSFDEMEAEFQEYLKTLRRSLSR
jgi:hypothetical protein